MASDRTDGALTHQSQANLNPLVTSPSIVSGTAFQPNPTLDVDLYASALGGASGGNITVAVGPTNAVATTLLNGRAAAANTLVALDFHLPAGWFIKFTATSTVTFPDCTVITS